MGQIIGRAAKPKRCNLNKLSQLGTPAAGEYILVSSDNSMNAAGQGNFDAYVVGDGHTAATALPLIKTYANDADDEPVAGSEKLVKSGGVAEEIGKLQPQLFNGIVDGSSNVWKLGTNKQHFLIPVNGGESVVFDAESNYMYCAFLKTYTTPVAGATPDFCTGYEGRQGRSESSAFTIPSDCRYFIIDIGESSYIPTKLEINGVDIVNGVYGGIFNVGKKITELDNESVKNADINDGVVSVNLADPEGVIDGKFINSAGGIGTNASWAMLKIPASPGKYYTIGGLYLGRSAYYAFYDNSDSLISFGQISDPNGRVSPQTTAVAPANTAYLYVDIKTNSSPSNPYQYMQVNEGTYLHPYNKYVGGVVRVFDKKIVGEDYELGKVVSGALFRNPEKHNDFVNTGYVAWGTGALSVGGYRTTDFIPVKEGETVVVKDLNASSSVAGLSAYSSMSESSYIQSKSVKGTNSDTTFNYVVPNGVNYIRLSRANSNTIAEYGFFPYVPYLSKDDVAVDISSANDKIATVGIVKEQTTPKAPVRLYPQTKLPCVSFQFDDCPNSDSDVVTLFNSYGLTCAFAFIASEENIVSKAERYRFYQQKGFQIMNHSVDGTIFNTTNYTYATAQTAIVTALTRIEKAGIICNGFVSPSSSMATEFLPILKANHAYAFTSATSSAEANGRSQDTCQLHRFNMQATPLADIKTYIDNCITNDQIMTFYGHAANLGTTYGSEVWSLEKIAAIIEYCIDKRNVGLLYVGGTDDCVKYFFDLNP
jgi:hypothetical protein